MVRIILLLAVLLGSGFSAFNAVWEMTGPSSDPWGKPNGQSPPPGADSGPDIDPWG